MPVGYPIGLVLEEGVLPSPTARLTSPVLMSSSGRAWIGAGMADSP